jgi:hypothetical protein
MTCGLTVLAQAQSTPWELVDLVLPLQRQQARTGAPSRRGFRSPRVRRPIRRTGETSAAGPVPDKAIPENAAAPTRAARRTTC